MRTALAAALLFAAAACSPAEVVDSSTSTSSTTTSTTSTTLPPTTTTPPPTTTTTVPPSTTTTEPGISGNWADQPLIVTAWGAVGWWAGSGWVGSFGSLPISGGEDYQVVSVSGSGIVSGGSQIETCEPLNNLGVELSEPEKLGEWPGPFGVAVSAGWDVQPHLVEAFTDDGTYAGHARDLLSARGLTVASPVITQLFRLDLEGDGVNEVLVVAEDMPENFFEVTEDNYSIAFLRKVVDGEVQTAIFGASVSPESGEQANTFSIGGVGDLSGDGKMEIVISGTYYEGAWIEVWEYVDDDMGASPQLTQGCGA